MGGRRPLSLSLVLILAILCLSVPEGFARNIKIMRRYGVAHAKSFAEVSVVKGRETAELGFSTVDYNEPGANPRSSALWGSPPPPQR